MAQGSQQLIKAVRGTRDLLPPETALWARIEATARAVFARYGFGEIRTPVFEATELFARGVGEETDIVSKEMYTWEDGERFSEQKLEAAWVKANQELVHFQGENFKVAGSGRPVADLIVFRKATNVLEFVEFKSKASVDSLRQLRETIVAARQQDAVNFGRLRIIARLVVPAGTVRLPVAYKADPAEIVEEFAGDFFDSSQSLTLRPENTAGVVRAYIEHKLGETGALQKLFYIGPQFRRERPQRGRYRQFWQIGCEVLGPVTSGSESAVRDAEVLEMLSTLLDELGVRGWELALNSVGSAEDRRRYSAALREALGPVKRRLSEDNQRRAETNPLRVLDSKEPGDQAVIEGLPKIADYLSEEARTHFEAVCAALDACGVKFAVNPRLVRGLDYYTRTTFEFTVPSSADPASGLGTQNALLGGGRYDGLSEMLGGPKAPGIGFAIGEDRLVLTLQAQAERDSGGMGGGGSAAEKLDAYIAPMGTERNAAALALARELRRAGLRVEVGDGSFRLKKSFEAADKVARQIVILGEDEVAGGTATVKTFATGEQVRVERGELAEFLR